MFSISPVKASKDLTRFTLTCGAGITGNVASCRSLCKSGWACATSCCACSKLACDEISMIILLYPSDNFYSRRILMIADDSYSGSIVSIFNIS